MSRKVTVATTGLGARYGPEIRDNIARGYELLDVAGAHGPDIACLPEVFPLAGRSMSHAHESVESVPGPVFDELASRARRYRMYVLAGVVEQRDGRLHNTIWVIDRDGQLAGRYDKRHPTNPELDAGVVIGRQPGIVETDFGRLGIATCYDIGWPDLWDELGRDGAELIVWPSAYGGGFPLRTYAWRNAYHVVSTVWTHDARVIDPVGRVVASTDQLMPLVVQEIDLDTLVMHADGNEHRLGGVLTALGRNVTVTTHVDERVITLVSNDPARSTADIARDFGLQSYRDHYAAAQRRQDASLREAANSHLASPA